MQLLCSALNFSHFALSALYFTLAVLEIDNEFMLSLARMTYCIATMCIFFLADFIQPENFPEHVILALQSIKEREEKEIRQKELEKSTCKVFRERNENRFFFYYMITLTKY